MYCPGKGRHGGRKPPCIHSGRELVYCRYLYSSGSAARDAAIVMMADLFLWFNSCILVKSLLVWLPEGCVHPVCNDSVCNNEWNVLESQAYTTWRVADV
jgi:hypothetical protein